jgi:hypothetical protein
MNTKIRPLLFNTDKPESNIMRWGRETANKEVARKLFMTVHTNKLIGINFKILGDQ